MRHLSFFVMFLSLLCSVQTAFATSVCDINPHIRDGIVANVQKSCEKITAFDLIKIKSFEANLDGTELAPTDFPEGLRPQSISLSGIANADMVDVLSPLSTVRELKLSLSFNDQIVNFRKQEFRPYFEELQLSELSLSHFQLKFNETFELDAQRILAGQKLATKVTLDHTNITYIPFHMFDTGPLAGMTSVVLTNNNMEWFVGQVIGDLPNLRFVDLSGNALKDHFEMDIINCGEVTVKACNMGGGFDKDRFKSKVRRHPQHPACICGGGTSFCKLIFDFCE